MRRLVLVVLVAVGVIGAVGFASPASTTLSASGQPQACRIVGVHPDC